MSQQRLLFKKIGNCKRTATAIKEAVLPTNSSPNDEAPCNDGAFIPKFRASVTPSSSSSSSIKSYLVQKKYYKKPRTLQVFNYILDPDPQTIYLNKKCGLEQRCRYCKAKYTCSSSTSKPSRYLIEKEGYEENDRRDAKATKIQANLKQALVSVEAYPQKRRRLDLVTLEQDKVEVLQVRTTVAANLPFNLVKCLEFRAFLIHLNIDSINVLLKSYNSVREQVFRQSKVLKTNLKESLASTMSKIYIS